MLPQAADGIVDGITVGQVDGNQATLQVIQTKKFKRNF